MYRRCRKVAAADPRRPAARGIGVRARGGLTLLELLVAMSLMVLIVGSLGALAKGVQMSFEHGQGHGTATQHARVVLERIVRTANEATASEAFPGFIVLAEYEGSWRFPDTLVVWRPTAAAADPAGLPRYNELVVFCPNPAQPEQLLEITVPGDTRTVPPLADTAGWAANIAAMKTAATSNKVRLTSLLRTATTSNAGGGTPRAAVRFETRLRPSQAEWTAHVQNTLAWNQLVFPQDLRGARVGVRQAWLRAELQLLPAASVAATPAQSPLAFFGSAAVYYPLTRRN